MGLWSQPDILMHGIFFLLYAFLMLTGPGARACDTTFRPVVMVHGFLGGGDNFAPMIRHLGSAGFCNNRMFVFDWNSLSRTDQTNALNGFIDSILSITRSDKVNLIGHSAGGGLAYVYLKNSAHAKKVAQYVHVGSSVQSNPAGPNGSVPTLNLYSTADRVVKSGDIPGAENIRFATYDHFEVVTADSAAMAVFRFFTAGLPYTGKKTVSVSKKFRVTGKVLSLGENIPQASAKLELWGIRNDGEKGKKIGETVSGPQGGFSFNGITPNGAYLLYCTPTSGRKVAYFLPRLQAGEQLLYLRILPTTGLVQVLLSGLPTDSLQAALVLFSSQKAILHYRDKLLINETELSTPEFADPAKTSIAWFLYDANKNGRSDKTLIPSFSAAPFMRGVDYLVSSVEGANPYIIQYNGATYRIPVIPASEAVTIVVL